MRRALLVIALVLAGLALPSIASPGTVIKPLITSLALTAGDATKPLTTERMVAVTWQTGHPQVRYRWHTPSGWTSWQVATDDSADSPQGSPGTEPLWRPPHADLIDVHVTGASQPRLISLYDGKPRSGPRTASAQTGRAILGTVHSRADWGADESIRRGRPSYAPGVAAVVVHHTANPNGYSRADVPAIIRADYAYHVQTRGWADIGYNLLVDSFGGIWEGRAGGLGRATVGAHAEGFNTGTLGVALIGDLTQTAPTEPAQRALAHVIAYAAATWHFDPVGSVALTSGGSPRFSAGKVVTLHRVFGHQETGATSCPGSLQGLLPTLRALAKVGLGPAPVISRVDVTGAPVHAPTPLVVDAQLTRAAGWSVTVTDANNAVVAQVKGSGTEPQQSWNGFSGLLPALPGSYRWTVAADDGFHDAVTRSGGFEVGLPLVG